MTLKEEIAFKLIELVSKEMGYHFSEERIGNAPRYVGMLRRAAELIGAAKILFVSHNPETHDLADSIININPEGTVTVK